MTKETIQHALTIPELRERYEYVYDALCDYFDTQFREKNHCQFENGQCFVNREGLGKNREFGCCYSFNLDFFLNIRDKKVCEYLVDTKCAAKCITCKLYTCKHLERKGISYSLLSFPDIKKVFNRNQIEVLKSNPFDTRENIINRLLEVKKMKMPYFLFYMFGKAKVIPPPTAKTT
jgi:hypothetical protein